ncbi:MAG: dihydrodipicolinate synthase family protein [Bryobacteraceae bacterium]
MPEITIRGVIAALLTPFDSRGAVDWEALTAQASGVEAAGVHAICVGGTASELAGSTAAEFGQVCKSARSAARIPMLASIYPDSTLEAIELGRAAADAGASVLLVSQPHYLFQPGADNFADMLQQIRRNVPLPLMAANTMRTAMLSTTDLRRLVERGVIDGIVQGGGEAHILADLLCLPVRPPVYSAIDELAYLSYLLKAEGMVSTLAAVFPAECVEIYTAQKAGDHDRARRMHERLLRIWRALDHPSELLARLKLAAVLRGRPAGVARSPYQAASPETRNNLRELLVREEMIA